MDGAVVTFGNMTRDLEPHPPAICGVVQPIQSEAIAANRITLHETGQADTIKNTHQCKPTSGMHKLQPSIELRLPVSKHLGVPGMVDKLVRFIKGLS